MIAKIFVLTVLLAGVNCRYFLVEERPLHIAEDGVFGDEFHEPLETVQLHLVEEGPRNLAEEGVIEEEFHEPLDTIPIHPLYNSRVRRQAQTTFSVDGKTGNTEIAGKLPVARTDNNAFSVIASKSSDASQTLGLAFDNAKGHGLSLSEKTIPDFGKQLTAAGKVNLLHNDKHDVTANAFLTRNMPNPVKLPDVPNFNTYGGGLGYTFNDKIGASIGAARTDFLKRTDVNALGHLNLFRNKDSSFDFNAGAARSFSPYIPKSSWEPTFGFSFTKSW